MGVAGSTDPLAALPAVGRRAALVRAHELASGDLLAWVDSDDIVDPDGLALCAGDIDDDHQVAYSYRWLIDELGQRRGSHQKNAIPYSPLQLLVSNMVFHLRVFTRQVFEQAGGVGDLESAIDWDLNLRMTELTDVRCVPIELYSYRVRQGRMSGSAGQMRNAEMAVRRAIARRGLDVELVVEGSDWFLRRLPA